MIEQVHEDTDVLSDHVKCPTCKRGRLCDKPAGVRVTVLTLKTEALSKQNCRIILKCPKCSDTVCTAVCHLYLYQSVAVNCTAAPLAVFSILFGVGAIFLIAFGRWTFLPLGLLMSLHLFGCRADVHLLEALRKYESASLLVKDTGSEQWLYDRKQKEPCHTSLPNRYDDRSG